MNNYLMLICISIVIIILYTIIFIYLKLPTKSERLYKKVIKKKKLTLYETIFKYTYNNQLIIKLKKKFNENNINNIERLEFKSINYPYLSYKYKSYFVRINIYKNKITIEKEYLCKGLGLITKTKIKNILNNINTIDSFIQRIIEVVKTINLEIDVNTKEENINIPLTEKNLKSLENFKNYIVNIGITFGVILNIFLLLIIMLLVFTFLFNFASYNGFNLIMIIIIVILLSILYIHLTIIGISYLNIYRNMKKDIYNKELIIINGKPIKVKLLLQNEYRGYYNYIRGIKLYYFKYVIYVPINEYKLIYLPRRKKEIIKRMKNVSQKIICLKKSKIVICGKESFINIIKQLI